MRLLQPSALGRANVAGRVSDGARQNMGTEVGDPAEPMC